MQINEQQAELILDAFSFCEDESMLGNEALVLVSEIMEAFPGLDHALKSVCEEVSSHLLNREGAPIPNVEGISRLQEALKSRAESEKIF